MISHLLGADVVDIDFFIFGEFDAFIDAFLEFTLVELHGVHIELHVLLLLLHAIVVFLEG